MGEYFQGIKVGDRVWSCVYGWGSVHAIDDKSNVELVVLVCFDMDKQLWHRLDGRPERGCHQTLFWDEVKITPPPKPKRMVKKEISGYAWWTENSGMTFRQHPLVAPQEYKRATLIWEEEE